jgi:1,4-alpha-glucan branching enzyme
MAKRACDFPVYLFNEGTNYESYRLMRINYVVKNKHKVWRFRVWAPNAESVSIVGDFNKWTVGADAMVKIGGGIWEGFVKGLKKFDNYKFAIKDKNKRVVLKADPFALHTETPPHTASKVYDITGFRWTDAKFMQMRKNYPHWSKPMNIYEVHAGSFKRNNGEYLDYISLADTLIPYVKDMGYTHIELLPLTEYPFGGSWGYQATGLYAPTSRYGTPHDFMYFVNKCHENGIFVILDFVISHFPKDEFGLYEFDGTKLYEYDDPCKMEHKTWGTRVYDYTKGPVQSFLISAVNFWLEYYHIDGIRLDAVASMLYLNYDRKDGEWRPNAEGGIINLEAKAFLQKLNKAVLTKNQGVIMIAEESTAFPMVTMPEEIGGLGFHYKWNMGWMNDTLDYIKIDPYFRKDHHDKLTFSLTYAFSENYILPFSHDEVVHGKASMISKIPGEYQKKFEGLKALCVYQMTHPGKKLNFMGNEIAQFVEWDYRKELDWILLDFETHKQFKNFVRRLNHFYKADAPLYELDCDPTGFKWIVVDDKAQNVIAYSRYGAQGEESVIVINFADAGRKKYRIGVDSPGGYRVEIDSLGIRDGSGGQPKSVFAAENIPSHGREYSIEFSLAANQAMILKNIDDRDKGEN